MRTLTLAVLLSISAAAAADLTKLDFLAGCWTTVPSTPTALRVDEHWSKPAAGNMLGYSRTFRGDRMVFFEFMRIEAKGGDIVFTPRYGTSEKPVPFKLIKSTGAEAVFENPEHDFPQRIVYSRQAGDNLSAAVEGMDKGKPRREDFAYVRTACP